MMPFSGLHGHQVCMWHTCIHQAKNTKTKKIKTHTPKMQINKSLKAFLFSCLNLTSKAAFTLITGTCIVNDKAMLKHWALTQNIHPKQVPLFLCPVKHCKFSTMNSVSCQKAHDLLSIEDDLLIFNTALGSWWTERSQSHDLLTFRIFGLLLKKKHKTSPHDMDALFCCFLGLWSFLLLA